MTERSTGAIALRLVGNDQGRWQFISLTTSCDINRRKRTPIPMYTKVIDHVHVLARRHPRGLTLFNHNQQPLKDNNADKDEESYPLINDDSNEPDTNGDDDISPDTYSDDPEYEDAALTTHYNGHNTGTYQPPPPPPSPSNNLDRLDRYDEKESKPTVENEDNQLDPYAAPLEAVTNDIIKNSGVAPMEDNDSVEIVGVAPPDTDNTGKTPGVGKRGDASKPT